MHICTHSPSAYLHVSVCIFILNTFRYAFRFLNTCTYALIPQCISACICLYFDAEYVQICISIPQYMHICTSLSSAYRYVSACIWNICKPCFLFFCAQWAARRHTGLSQIPLQDPERHPELHPEPEPQPEPGQSRQVHPHRNHHPAAS